MPLSEVRTELLPEFDDQSFALDLLEKKHVLVAPGVSFNVAYKNAFRITKPAGAFPGTGDRVFAHRRTARSASRATPRACDCRPRCKGEAALECAPILAWAPALLAAAASGRTILAPNAELSAALFDAIERAHRAAGDAIWPTPRVFDIAS